GNMAEECRRTGDWDAVLEELGSAIEGGSGDLADLMVESGSSQLLVLRGELDDAAARGVLDKLGAIDDADVAAGALDIRGLIALTSNDPSGAAGWWIQNADRSPLNAQYALPKAAFAALLAGDAATARNAIDRLVTL